MEDSQRGNASMMSMMDDPFVVSPEGARDPPSTNQYSTFDAQLFNLDASTPAQAKRALEAHLAETERRLEEASKLGTALVEQRKDLEDKLREVEQQQEEGQIGEELRRKLADLEREYNEIGQETARAFLAPKRLAGGDDGHLGTPSMDQKSPLHSALFAGQATNSPSKVSVPSRKSRNQSNRVHDIEFATEISTSLLAQVRQLQSLLAEREETLKTVNLEKSRLELEAEGYAQRIRALDESEERYKDENWALETKIHELMAAVKDVTDRETKLTSSLGAATAEKSAMERELEDLKQANAKLIEDHTAAQKANDAEINTLRRNLSAGDAERLTLQRKLEDMNTQNQELAKAVAMRLRQQEAESTREVVRPHDSEDEEQATPENSPPPSPNKFTPRHNHLETETLRSSLGHAHRMIQNLRSTIHREKTEKIELKRMLQEARDEVEQRRRDSVAANGPTNKRQKTKAETRKPARPDLLGAGRKKAEVEIHDSDWESNAGDISPTHKASNDSRDRRGDQPIDDRSDAYHTATEADDPFETANERETTTESEAFQTGVESMAGDSTDSDELTETEDRVQRTPRGRVSSMTLAKARDRTSYYSTASTSADEGDSTDPGTPSISQFSTPRYRLRKKRSVLRKIRPSGEAPMAFNSRPSSARESPSTSFTRDTSAAPEGQSLFAELAEVDGDEDDFGPPMQFEAASPSTPRMLPGFDSRRPSAVTVELPSKPDMVDSGVMTDPWEPNLHLASQTDDETVISVPVTPDKPTMSDASTGMDVVESPSLVHSSTQWTPLKPNAETSDDHVLSVPTPPKMAWDGQTLNEERKVDIPDSPTTQRELNISSVSFEETEPVAPSFPELRTAFFVGSTTEPVAAPVPVPPEVALSPISSQTTQPTEPVIPAPPEPEPIYVPEMAFSQILVEDTLPILAKLPEPAPERVFAEQGTSTDIAELSVSAISSEQTEPVEPVYEPKQDVAIVAEAVPEGPLSFVEQGTNTDDVEISFPAISSVETEPVAPVRETKDDVPEPVLSLTEQGTSTDTVEFSVSSISSEETEPVEPIREAKEEAAAVDDVASESTHPVLSIFLTPPAYTEPTAPKLQEAVIPPAPQLALSTVSSVETPPVQYTPDVLILPTPPALDENTPPSVMASTAKATKSAPPLVVVDDNTDKGTADGLVTQQNGVTLPLGAISGNAAPRRARSGSSNQADQGAQTILSSKQIDQLLIDRASVRPLSPPDSDKLNEMSNSPFATPKARSRPVPQASNASLHKRPGSAASQASSVQIHPPLPADHKEAIMAAEKKSIDQRPASAGLMGPPLAPASAVRASSQQRPRTPNESALQVGSAKTTTSRASVRRDSHMSRRSSVSSFASELEERFNMQPNPPFAPQGYSTGTDPRMIQAITQTMIGEFLWKYTRRAVSGEISNTRHRRYFWVHPYTRTLYWSEHDPQSAGKSEGRTKSVSIEAVRVVADDNPYPPGLHCKSLEVVSPGRRIRFTATTSQRHETWFNALSYLLVRNGPEDEEAENGVTLDDIDEFNPGFRSRSRQTARMSVSSSQSRGTRGLPKQRSGSAMSLRPSVTPGRASPYPPSHYSDQARQASSSRLSTIFNSTIKGSFGRKGPYAASSLNEDSIHNHDDSVEDLRHMMDRGDDVDRLENVRACCDGKHDVSSLSRTSRYSPRANRIHSHH
ncbi:APSA_EMENI Anucleate primary sterigmata protein A [Aspergillus nidulans FGSC A4]|uniref:Anucleate primary sterigmata protein A n=1 Tax=Emericella nidulans (strain FGSC A4 / ATCC 38163 / CBS 112.46 / NRRL 194 / M139) TaxID=227321 RepID=APSA_EMENI|nr:protein apsA [Aspergillus nidulans FGSC A4]Q00083.2 RecName: Full=Anucleate primary sterigmata protein A [Aspergillus nidulans FGSC A4]EAA61545.1 APSA_EMENI Anucleate primary sterigmata protein A [Aspergillus nidulans FGSC A4]CBF80046.1 TPA: Anucleate primary sterigmata protein A [Source:UniProtKB/Swiss-Prot;Acc:Q00083] [Aspergillus nidulans FGSC A4]|eukprot:XP_681026.1 APSA_EMENI Anucleate primary sterigmata protein A [Aspergillus nidulans FGSC A4]